MRVFDVQGVAWVELLISSLEFTNSSKVPLEPTRTLKRPTAMLLASLVLLSATPQQTYLDARDQLTKARLTLAHVFVSDAFSARNKARERLRSYFETQAFPAWKGTPWNFYGTSQTPQQGTIACGYYVTTLMEHAGFRIERVVLAKQASAYLVASVARGTAVEWLRPASSGAAIAAIRKKWGDGMFVVGLDLHVGFLLLQGEESQFCHASYLGDATVLCEDALTSGAFVSSLYVVADALNDNLVDDWILQRTVPSQLPKVPVTK
jgi:hypothetical protein